MMFGRGTRIGAVLVMVMCAAASLDAGQEDVVTRARGLAVAGQRTEAITLLQDAVAASPGNTDARVLLGTVLSWEGRYDEARRVLEGVLTESPTQGDALLASINVELWSDHAGRAEELSRRGLQQRPTDPNYLLTRARALVTLTRSSEARETLDRLLLIDPRNQQALEMRRSLKASLLLWQVHAGGSYAAFNDHRVAWREWETSVSRTTPVGSILFSGSRAERFGLTDNQVQFEMYPRFRAGTYASVAGAYSPDAILYPRYRYAADLYQSLGAGFEVSAGFRRLGFERGVNIYVGTLSKYYGSWLATGRLFVTPNSAGTSRSVNASLKRYFGDGSSVGVSYGRGGPAELRNRNDFDVLDSEVAAVETTFLLGSRLGLNVTGSYSRENRVERLNLQQYSLSTGLGFRF